MSTIRNLPAVSLVAALMLATGCAGDSPSNGPRVLQRAVDSFDESSVVGSPGLDSLSAPSAVLFEQTFESWAADGWQLAFPAVGNERAVPAASLTDRQARSGRLSFEIGVADGPPRIYAQLHRAVPVEPGVSYLLRASVRTDELEPLGRESLGASVELFEFGEPGQGAPVSYHGHLPRERGTSQEWRQIEYSFRTTPKTRRLTVALVGATGRATGRAYFDDVSLTRLTEPGSFLRGGRYASPLRDAPHELVRNATVGDDSRPAIVSPVGTVWIWPVETADGARLRFGAAAVGEPAGGAEICFSVSSNFSKLFDECRPATAAGAQQWQDVTVDLPESTTLRFESRWSGESAPSTGGLAVWGNPQIVPTGSIDHARRPDVVLILFDTLRRDHLGAEGYTRHPTSPRIDALASESVRYNRAFAPSAWTTTTVGSLVTGRYPSQHGAGLRIPREIETSDRISPPGRARALSHDGISPTEVTLAELLRAAGYETVGFHRNFLLGADLGFARGFDRYRFYKGADLTGGMAGAELASEWLKQRRAQEIGTPFFLMFHVMDPHLPYRMRQEYYEEFGPPRLPGGKAFDTSFPFVAFHRWPATGVSEVDLQRIVAMYDSEIAYADRAVGVLLDALQDRQNTVIVVTSDHGEGFGEHELFEHGNSMYDELLSVPLYVRLPERRGAGTAVDDPVSLIDVAPTVLSLVGLEPPAGVEGRPLPGLPGVASVERPRRGLFAGGSFLGPDQTALIRDGYKYILTHPQGYLGFQDGTPEQRRAGVRRPAMEELYALDDEQDRVDVRSGQPDTVNGLRQAVRDYLEETAYGLHVRCGGGDAVLTLESSATIGEIKPMTLEQDDTVDIAPSRRRLTLQLRTGAGSPDPDEDWLIVRFLDGAADIDLTVGAEAACPSGFDAVRGKLGSQLLPASPVARPAAEGCWCQLWHVPRPGEGASGDTPTLDDATRDRLRALGYVR